MTISVRLLWVALVFLGLCSGAKAEPDHYRTYITGQWGQIHARVVGRESDPTVILLHQMVWSSVQFKFAQTALAARGIRSIAVDIPGYGLSDGPDAEPTIAQYADTLLPVLDHFHLKRAVLLGNNTGATLSADFAVRHPDRVSKIILEGVPIFDAAKRAKLLADRPYDQTPKADGSHLSGRWTMIAGMVGDRMSLAGIQESVLQFFTAGPKEWFAHDAVYRYSMEDTVKRVPGPVMVLTYPGQELYKTSMAVTALRPDFEIRVLDWKGINPSYDAPDLWADAVAASVHASVKP